MTVYVDCELVRWRGRSWCHLVADSIDELHAFAGLLGLQRQWFQDRGFYPHYDVTASVRSKALKLGARNASRETMISRCKVMRSELLRAKDVLP